MVSIAKSMEAPVQSKIDLEYDDDDKSLKEMKQGPSFFYVLLAVLPCHSTCTKQFIDFLMNPLKVYTVFLACTAVFYLSVCGGAAAWEDFIGYNSCILEAYGLISVYRKIKSDRSVIGISGNSLIMFAISYGLRQCEAFVMSSRFRLTKRAIALEALQFASIPLVLSLLWAVFKTYRETYQESLDKLKVQYLIPACMVLAFTLTPRFKQGDMYSYCWSISFYVDVLALLPQVVMMTFSPGAKVAVPIANFVFVTAISRIVDLWFWYFHFDLGPQGWWGGFNFSGYVIVIFHVISLVLVADFMYMYMRARCSAYHGDDKQAAVDEARGVFAI
jgi:hypothetical protein